MKVSNIAIRNWRNFKNADVKVQDRTFIVGANASGKSNFLDIFRFLRDIASSSGGGLQKAIKDRGGMKKVRSLAARKEPNILLEITMTDEDAKWRYLLEITQESAGKRRPLVKREEVYKGDEVLLKRPDEHDQTDPERLTQTSLEQVNSNVNFREISEFFAGVVYLHLVPQLLKYAEGIQGQFLENDPFGQAFLERIAATGDKKRARRLSESPRFLRRLNTLRGLSHEEVEQVLTRGA